MPLFPTTSSTVRVMEPSEPSVSRRREWSRAWAVAAVLMVGIVAVGVPVGFIVIKLGGAVADAPGRVSDSLTKVAAQAMQPKITVREVVMNSIKALRRESKLVVFTADINADITREEGSVSWGMYWGTNVSRVAVRDAKVQFVIDFSKLQTSDVIYDERTKILTVLLPHPRVDASMVAIDPAQIQTLDLRGGWARFDKQETRDHAVAELKPQVISQAQAPFVRELADSAGIDAASKLIGPVAGAVSHDGTEVRVAYRD